MRLHSLCLAVAFIHALPLPGAQGLSYRGEELIGSCSPRTAGWSVAFEVGTGRQRLAPLSSTGLTPSGSVSVQVYPEGRAVGIACNASHADLSAFGEIHIWVRADADLRVQPFTQSSGYVFRDGGEEDRLLPADGPPVALRIRNRSVADPTMVEAVGVQVREQEGRNGARLEIVCVTGVRRASTEAPAVLRISAIGAPAAVSKYGLFTASFTLNRTYDNPYDPAQIDVQAEISLPTGRSLNVPAFYFQDYTVSPGTEKYESYEPRGTPEWRVRFLPLVEGPHQLRVHARDKDGNTEDSGPVNFAVTASRARGPVRRHPSNPIHLQFDNGTTYLPRGYNLGFEDGNPDLNGTAYYSKFLTAFGANGLNWTRYWMTDFARSALEWSKGHFSGFYSGVGIYSQRAAWRVDRFMQTAADSEVHVQLVLNDHGQFSTYANQRWDGDAGAGSSGNPYNAAAGGPVPQANPELFFSDPTAKALFKRRLRYVIARWSAFPNLLAWELWNEVQWAGTSSKNFRTDSATRAAIVDWHREMSDYLKANDPFAHLVTTSSDDPGASGFPAIWNLPGIDIVQSHHYNQPPSSRDKVIRDYVVAAQQAYGKPAIVAETGAKASSEPECDFDPETFLGNTAVPASERTAANRDHVSAGTTLRNSLWPAAVSQSGGMYWWWGCYICEDSRRNRRAPDFPLDGRLFPALSAFWGGENIASGEFRSVAPEIQGSITAFGLQGKTRAFAWVRDTRDAYGTGAGPAATEQRSTTAAAIAVAGLDAGTYVASFHETAGNGNLLSEVELNAANGRLTIELPSFFGDMAVKVSDGTTRGWGLVPRSSRAWTAGGSAGSTHAGYAALRGTAGPATPKGGAIISLTAGPNVTSDLMVPAVRLTREFWTVAEIEAPSNVGIALANTGSALARVLLELFDSSGKPAGDATLELQPGHHAARFLGELLPGRPGPFRGTVRVTSSVPIAALPLRGTTNRRAEYVLTTLPARYDEATGAGAALVLSQVADGGGYQTEWLLVNPLDVTLGGRVLLRRTDGSPWALEVDGNRAIELSYRIPSHGLVRWLSAGSEGSTQSGYCVLQPDPEAQAPTAAAVVRFLDNGLQSETGVAFSNLSPAGGSFWESSDGIYSGVAFANPGDRSATGRLELFVRDGGEKKLETTIGLKPGEQTARLLHQLFPDLPSEREGYLRYTFDSAVGFLALRIRNTPRGDVLTSSLLLGDLADDEDRAFPQVVWGGGYYTRFALVNPDNCVSEGRIAFRNSDGSPARIILRGR